MKISSPRNLKYFNLLFLGLFIQIYNPVLPKTSSSKNSLTSVFEKSYFKENLKSHSSINKRFQKQISSRVVEKGVFGDEAWSIEISNPVVERGTSAVNSELRLKENLDQSRNLEIQQDKQFQEKKENLDQSRNLEIQQDKQFQEKNENLDQSRNLEIKSDKQFQEKSVIYAEGNVLVTYGGNVLKADSLVYDKLNETLSAIGNIKLILENQVFSLNKLDYDFKNQKGSFLNVKAAIKTKNLLENLDLSSNQIKDVPPT